MKNNSILPGDAAIRIERTEEYMATVMRLSDFIQGLSLKGTVNNQLTALIMEQTERASKDAFAQGFVMGLSFGRDGG